MLECVSECLVWECLYFIVYVCTSSVCVPLVCVCVYLVGTGVSVWVYGNFQLCKVCTRYGHLLSGELGS